MNWFAILWTLAAWFVGMFIDANIGCEPIGFLELRTLFPVIAMGCCVLRAVEKQKTDEKDDQNKE